MWNDREEEKKEATWDEQSDFRKDFYRSLTFSEFDRAHKTVVFCHEQDIPARELNGCSVTDKADQINFISQYYILTHQGTYEFDKKTLKWLRKALKYFHILKNVETFPNSNFIKIFFSQKFA